MRLVSKRVIIRCVSSETSQTDLWNVLQACFMRGSLRCSFLTRTDRPRIPPELADTDVLQVKVITEDVRRLAYLDKKED